MNKKIGIFDSGVGGLTVLKSLIEILPNEDYVYIGDNKNCPYGDKIKEELYSYASKIIKYFISLDVKLVVIACNTISATILEDLQKEFSFLKIIGVIDITVKEVAKLDCKNLLIIGTNITIKSDIYAKKIRKFNKFVNIKSVPTPLLVPEIEKSSSNIDDVLNNYLKDADSFDTILLGCTHYEIIRDLIVKNYNLKIVSSSTCLGNDVYNYLKSNNLFGDKFCITILTTGNKDSFYKVSKNILDYEVKEIKL